MMSRDREMSYMTNYKFKNLKKKKNKNSLKTRWQSITSKWSS